jgi:hypothetical protein
MADGPVSVSISNLMDPAATPITLHPRQTPEYTVAAVHVGEYNFSTAAMQVQRRGVEAPFAICNPGRPLGCPALSDSFVFVSRLSSLGLLSIPTSTCSCRYVSAIFLSRRHGGSGTSGRGCRGLVWLAHNKHMRGAVD